MPMYVGEDFTVSHCCRDETDVGRKEAVSVSGSGDAPVYKPGHARKPSVSAPKDLEPIRESTPAKPTNPDSDSDKDSTIKADVNSQVGDG